MRRLPDNRCSHTIAQLEVPGNEVRMEVRQDDMLDPETMLLGKPQVSVDVSLWIDDGRDARLLVAHEIRRVRQTVTVELLENHVVVPGATHIITSLLS